MKRYIGFLLSVLLVMALVPAVAVAEESVCVIGEQPYATLQDAIDAAVEGDTIKLTADIDYQISATNLCAVLVPEGKDITLDLNGFNISGMGDETIGTLAGTQNNNFLITNRGKLKIIGSGTLSMESVDNSTSWGFESAVIVNQFCGVLTIDSPDVTVEHKGGTGMAFAVDITGGQLNILDGTFLCTYRTIRAFPCLDVIDVNISGGLIQSSSNTAVWVQCGSGFSVDLDITDGTLISGGTNALNIYISSIAEGHTINVNVEGGNFTGTIYYYVNSSAADVVTVVVSGGVFTFDPATITEGGYLVHPEVFAPEGYHFAPNGEGGLILVKTVMGDADMSGVLDSADAAEILRYVVGIIDETKIDLSVCDVDLVNDVSSGDAARILRHIVGIDVQLIPSIPA